MFKCLRPRKIVNPYTHEEVICSCGKCDMCEINKTGIYSSLCNEMDKKYKYCMFVTLTYAPEFLPRCYVNMSIEPSHDVELFPGSGTMVHVPESYRFEFTSSCHRLGDYGEVIAEYETQRKEDIDDLDEFMNLTAQGLPLPKGVYCYLSARELQLFHKRFRNYALAKFKNKSYGLSKSEVQEICNYKHFSVGEYGGDSGRAHYHVLFFFESDRLLENFGEILSQAWTFGIIDYSISRGGVSSYVASYVNSLCDVPKILKVRGFKACKTHSVGFLQDLFKGREQAVYDSDYRQVIADGFFDGKQNNPSYLFGSLQAHLFPKCVNFARATDGELYSLFTILRESLRYNAYCGRHTANMTTLAFDLAYDIYQYSHCKDLKSPPVIKTFMSYFHGEFGDFEQIQSYVYRVLRLSKRFFEICSDDFLDSSESCINNRIRQIKDFYYCKDMYILGQWYQEIDEKLNDSALWLTVLFLYNSFISKACKLKKELYKEPTIFTFLLSFDKYLDIPFLHLGEVEDLEFRQRYLESQMKLSKHLKHKQLVSISNPNL